MHNHPSTKRIIVLSILLLLSISLMVLILSATGDNIQPEQTRSLEQAQDSQSIEKTASTPAQKTTSPRVDSKLENLISDWVKSQRASYSIAIQEIGGQSRSASYRANQEMVPASTYKLFLVNAILSNVESGHYELSAKLPSGQTLDECINSLLVISSDECAWELGNTIGWPEIDKFLYEQGYTNTKINNYDSNGEFIHDKLSSAADLMELLLNLETSKHLTKKHSSYMLSYMEQQLHRERIPAGLPTEIKVADKPGWLKGIENDAAIIWAPNTTYILVILSADGARPDMLAQLSELVFGYMTNTN